MVMDHIDKIKHEKKFTKKLGYIKYKVQQK